MDPALRKEVLAGDPDERIEAIVRLRDPQRPPPGLTLVSRFGPIATARLRRDDTWRIWADPNTVSIKAARLMEFAEAGAPGAPGARGTVRGTVRLASDQRRPVGLSATGRGVAVGIIDWGLDFAARSLRTAGGATRLLAMWDQRGDAATGAAARFGYGRAFDRAAIDAALAAPRPYQALGFHPGDADPFGDGSHGHHVADIIAGNGADGGPEGIAPEAELIFVQLAAGSLGGLANLGDSVRILEAVDFIAEAAGDRPLVINASLGRHGGDHRGVSLLEQALDIFLSAKPGRAIAMSAGNYFRARTHAAARIAPGRTRWLCWITDPSDRTPNELEIWYPNRDRIGLTIQPPGGPPIALPLGSSRRVTHRGRTIGHFFHRANDPNGQDHHVDLFLDPRAPAGDWRLGLHGERVVDGRFDAWIERDAGMRNQSRFSLDDVEDRVTTGSICNGFLTIACGACNGHRGGVALGSFSSSGPTRDGRSKPDIVAPGVAILAGRSTPRRSARPVPGLTRKTGTSQAAPHVTGTLALMFDAAGRPLQIHETRRALLGAARHPPAGFRAWDRAGSGALDIAASVEAARRTTPAPPQQEEETAMAEHDPRVAGRRAVASSAEALPSPLEAAAVYDALAADGGEAGGFAFAGWAEEMAESDAAPGLLVIERAVAEGAFASVRPLAPAGGPAEDDADHRSPHRGPRARRRAMLVRRRTRAQAPGTTRVRVRARARAEIPSAEALAEDAGFLRWVQQALNRVMNAGLAVDGISGPATRGAIRAFQQSRGLTVDGIVGPQTEGALRLALDGDAGPAGGGGPRLPSRCEGIAARETIDDFEFGKSRVRPRHQPKLVNICRCIHESWGTPDRLAAFTALGHTDDVGSDADNIALGRRRAEAVRTSILDRLRLMGSPASPTITIDTRGESDPRGTPAQNRRVELLFPHPFPRRKPPPPPPPPRPRRVDEARLRSLLRHSRLLTANPAAPFTGRSLPATTPRGRHWRFGISLPGPLVAADVRCRSAGTGGAAAPVPVFERIRWDDVRVELRAQEGGGTLTLPLDRRFLLGSFAATGGTIPDSAAHPFWRIAAEVDAGIAVAFAYRMAAGDRVEPVEDLGTLEPPQEGRSDPPWFLVCCELVLDTPRDTFEPARALNGARFFPMTEVLSNVPTRAIVGRVELRRPARSRLDHPWADAGRHVNGLYADRNEGLGAFQEFLDSRAGVSSMPLPFWDNIFDAAVKDADTTIPPGAAVRTVRMVDPARRGRRRRSCRPLDPSSPHAGCLREVIDRLAGSHVPTAVVKEPGQGAYDNIHIAPRMTAALTVAGVDILPPTPVAMAPVCSHDCVHMHWRWSRQFTEGWVRGWGPRGPATVPGAPMVQPNQQVTLSLARGIAGFRYEGRALAHPAGEWSIVMPHGGAYGLSMNVNPLDALSRSLTGPGVPSAVGRIVRAALSAAAASGDRAMTFFYFFIQFWPIPRLGRFPITDTLRNPDLPAWERL